MSKADLSATPSIDRSVLPWPIVAAAFLHFALPAYMVVGIACCAAGLLRGLTTPELASRALPYSVGFAILYVALATVGPAAAVMLDPLLRRRRRRRIDRAPDAPQRQSRHNLAVALGQGRLRLDRDAVAVLDAIASITWDHEQPAFRSISADLAEVVRASIAALTTAIQHERRLVWPVRHIAHRRPVDA